jgi:N-acylneuraminate cytidylyltransferase
MSRNIDINVLIAVRAGSKRVPNKNIRSFGNTNMLSAKVKQTLSLKDVRKVVVTSDSEEMLDIASDLGAYPMKRDPYYASDSVPMGDVYVHLASIMDCKDILWTPVTSPLVSKETIESCIDIYKNQEQYDSVVTTNIIQEYMWLDGKAINYDPKNHPRSQDLPKIYALNFAVNILSKETMIKNKNILGDNFYSYMIDDIESVDVDTEFDFKIAEMLYKNKVSYEES